MHKKEPRNVALFLCSKKARIVLMSRKSRVISATVLGILGVAVIIMPIIGGNGLHAAGLQSTGYNISQYLVWGGVGILVLSALLFISASTD